MCIIREDKMKLKNNYKKFKFGKKDMPREVDSRCMMPKVNSEKIGRKPTREESSGRKFSKSFFDVRHKQ